MKKKNHKKYITRRIVNVTQNIIQSRSHTLNTDKYQYKKKKKLKNDTDSGHGHSSRTLVHTATCL